MTDYTPEPRCCVDCKRYFYPNSEDQDYCFPCWREVRATFTPTKDPMASYYTPITSVQEGKSFNEIMADGDREAHGLRTMPYQEYLKTKWWQDIRKETIQIAQYKCQLCGKRGPAECNLHVHHLTYEHRGWEQPGDLVVLCSRCHEGVHAK